MPSAPARPAARAHRSTDFALSTRAPAPEPTLRASARGEVRPRIKASGDLFRQEALAALSAPRSGGVLLRPLLGSGWLALLAVLAAAAVLALLALGTYTRRASVDGALVPTGGVVRLVAPAAGRVLQQAVREGQAVAAGEVLFVLSTDRPTVGGADFQSQVVDSLQRRSASLAEAGTRVQAMAQAERAALQQRTESMRAELVLLAQQLAEQQRRVALAEETLERWRPLLAQSLVPRDQWSQKEADVSDQRARLQALQRDQFTLKRELAVTETTLQASRNREDEQQQLLLRERELMRQQSTENEARRRVVITAPRSGVITLVQATEGMMVDPQRPLALLLPADAALQVHLFAPSRAIGHVKPGTPVWLRYEAYPFERFGQQPAEVIAVSSSPATPDEISPWQGGVREPAPGSGGAASGEPLYLITAKLLDGGFNPAAGPVQLRPGLRVQADLMFETRRLYQWMLGPALQISGRGGV